MWAKGGRARERNFRILATFFPFFFSDPITLFSSFLPHIDKGFRQSQGEGKDKSSSFSHSLVWEWDLWRTNGRKGALFSNIPRIQSSVIWARRASWAKPTEFGLLLVPIDRSIGLKFGDPSRRPSAISGLVHPTSFLCYNLITNCWENCYKVILASWENVKLL